MAYGFTPWLLGKEARNEPDLIGLTTVNQMSMAFHHGKKNILRRSIVILTGWTANVIMNTCTS